MEINENFQLIDLLSDSNIESIYRASDSSTRELFIIKSLKPTFNTIHYNERLENELKIGQEVNSKFILRPIEIVRKEASTILLAEDSEGIILKDYIETNKIDIQKALEIILNLSSAIVDLHKTKIIHRNLHPENILYNPNNNNLRIINLRFASKYHDAAIISQNQNLTGIDLKYISPEQTGRMNRSTDYRTDFYSLGIIFYELIAGTPPFESDEQIDLIYKHVARSPVLIETVNEKTPKVISDIIVKLLEKNPENRYQNAHTIRNDIQRCVEEYAQNNEISNFKIAQNDISSNFSISEKLYGRDKERKKLINTFNEIKENGIQLVVLCGIAGTGKTSLIYETHPELLRQKAYFIEGKFNKFSSNSPYSGIIEALKSLVKLLLTENKENLEKLKNDILKSLPTSGQIMIDIIPEIELIIGKQPSIDNLSAEERFNRFCLSFVKFIQTFAKRDHPLVLFLDDIQWVDSSSLELLENLMTNNLTKHLLLILAYRSNEVENKHPLNKLIKKISQKNIKIKNLTTEPIELENTAELIKDTLHKSFKEIYNLSKHIHLKTKGNPFFVKQFLKTLYNQNTIFFDYEKNQWNWHIAEIETMNYTDNTAHYIIEIIQKLPPKILEILRNASCIGLKFDLKTLSLVNKIEARKTASYLNHAIRQGLITPINESFGFNDETYEELNFTYKFLHNNIHSSIYSLIPEQTKKKFHFGIGQIIENNCDEINFDDQIFNIVNQKNLGIEIISDKNELIKLSKQNLKAGIKAKESAAFNSALEYLQNGLSLLSENAWIDYHELVYSLSVEGAEAAYLTGNFEKSEILVTNILNNCIKVSERTRAHIIRIQAKKAMNKMDEALIVGLKAIKTLGVNFPVKPGKVDIIIALAKTKFKIGSKGIDKLSQLPEMKNEKYLAAMKIISNLLPTAYLTYPDFFPLLTFKQVQLSVKYGNSPCSSYAYVTYGLILAHATGNIDQGYKFGELALLIANKFQNRSLKVKANFVFSLTIRHLKRHLQESITPLYNSYLSALECGDLEYAGNSIATHLTYSFFSGKNLSDLQNQCKIHHESLLEINRRTNLNYLKSLQNTINLLINTDGKLIYDEDTILKFHENGNDALGIFTLHSFRALRSYLLGNSDAAIIHLQKARPFLNAAPGIFTIEFHLFFESLIIISQLRKGNAASRKKWLRIVQSNRNNLKKLTVSAPMNYKNKFLLVDAELNALRGNKTKAANLYNESIKCASQNNLILEKSLANLLFAEFLISADKDSDKYILNAYNGFVKLGALAIANKLENKYKETLINITKRSAISDDKNEVPEVLFEPLSSEKIDLNSIMKASLAISEAVQFDNLLKKLLNITITHLGATKGIILLAENDNIKIKAIQTEVMEEPLIVDSMPYENSKDLSSEIINYVFRTKKTIVLNNASDSGEFINTTYVKLNNPKSILCHPIIYQAKFKGILYAENNLLSNAFTTSKLEILELLNGHIAISIENTMFLEEMEQKVRKRTAEIENQKEEILSQTEHLRIINKDLEDKNFEINKQKREIFEQAHQLEQKNKELEKLSISTQKTDNAIVITDANGKIEWINEGFTRLYGYDLSEFKAEKGLTLALASSHPEIKQILKKIIKTKKSVSYGSEGCGKDNSNVWVQTTITPILDEYGKISKLVAIDSDISKLKEAEEEILKQKEEIEAQRDLANQQNKKIQLQNDELEKHRTQLEKLVKERTKELLIAKEKAEESDRLKSSFLANMSHEIRTPMNAIIGFSELIASSDIEKGQRKDLVRHLNNNCNSLLHLIDDIIDIARIEAGQLRILKQDCYVNRTIIELYESFNKTELNVNKEVELLVEIENTDENLSIITDPFRFTQILNNLIGNAIKFTEKGHVKFGYHIAPKGFEKYIRFFVEDTGIGLSNKEKKEIFEQFRKAQPAKKGKLYRGAGLGLAISKTLINKLGGDIWVESEPNKGSVFYFTLPYILPIRELNTKQSKEINYNWKGKNILLAEDEESNVKVIKLVLEQTKVNVLHAPNGQEAIDACKKFENIDLILMDIKMPILNGLDATRKIRKFNDKIPIIAFTAYAMPSDRKNARDAGFTDFVTKPIKKDVLLKTLNNYLKN